MDERIWRAERACAAAWPARDTIVVEGWHVHVSGGPTRRINAASPGGSTPSLTGADITAIDRVYSAVGQPTLLRVRDFAVGADAALDDAGFDAPEGRTRTMLAAIGGDRPAIAPSTERHPDERWMATRARLAPRIPADEMAAMFMRIAEPTMFVRRDIDGMGAAVAYGVIVEGLLVIEAVATDPAHRRHGLARDCVSTLMAWAHGRGVAEACLQVEADNRGAIALYEGLGFTTHLYDYHYRRRSRR